MTVEVVRDIDPQTLREDFHQFFSSHVHEAEGCEAEISLDWQMLDTLYNNGQLLIMGAYTVNNTAETQAGIGYIVDLIYPVIHRLSSTNAQTAAVYVSPEHRSAGVLWRLVTSSENKLRKLGVDTRQLVFKTRQKKLKRGYLLTEKTYTKRLN